MVECEEMVGDHLKPVGERKIVVAVDESEESMYALSWCLNNLVAGNDRKYLTTTTLVLLYVKPPPPPYPALDVPGYLLGNNDVVAAMEDYSRKLVTSVMNRAAEAVHQKSNAKYIKLEKIVGSGDAKEVIRETVTKLEADVLVLGSHGYGFFKRALLGSVSDYCSKHVNCPVVVVKLPVRTN